MKTKIDLTDKLTLEKVPELTLEECIALARAIKPKNWKPNMNNCKSYTNYLGKFHENEFGKHDFYHVSITKWHSGEQNVISGGGYKLYVEVSLHCIGQHTEICSEREGKIEKLFEDIENYKQNVDKNKVLKNVRKYIRENSK